MRGRRLDCWHSWLGTGLFLAKAWSPKLTPLARSFISGAHREEAAVSIVYLVHIHSFYLDLLSRLIFIGFSVQRAQVGAGGSYLKQGYDHRYEGGCRSKSQHEYKISCLEELFVS